MVTWQPGEHVVLRGRTVGTITAINSDIVTVTPSDARDGEGGFELPLAHAHDTLRPLATAEQARAAIAALGKAGADDDREISDRAIAYRRALKSGDLGNQIRELASIYHCKQQDYPERQYVSALENIVYTELSLVLGMSRRMLKAEVRNAVLGEQPPVSLSLPDRSAELAAQAVPELAGHGALGAFAIDTKLAIGEFTAELTIAALPGIWFVYVAGDLDDRHHLIAVHRDAIADLDQLARDAAVQGKVTAEGASVSLCDLAQLDDPEFVDAALSEGAGFHGQRCVVWRIDGDGSFPVSTASWNRGAVYVRIDFR